jgi:taurine dioxygenase
MQRELKTHFTNHHTANRVRFRQDALPVRNDLMSYLLSQSAVPEYQLRWRWTPGSVALWDNRCTQHYAVMDYPPCVRRMNRATIIGDRPF